MFYHAIFKGFAFNNIQIILYHFLVISVNCIYQQISVVLPYHSDYHRQNNLNIPILYVLITVVSFKSPMFFLYS